MGRRRRREDAADLGKATSPELFKSIEDFERTLDGTA